MLVCDLCRKPLVKGKSKWIETKDNKHICDECVKVCSDIIKDPNTGKITYLNQYKEERELRK